jgi:hypothetical protein
MTAILDLIGRRRPSLTPSTIHPFARPASRANVSGKALSDLYDSRLISTQTVSSMAWTSLPGTRTSSRVVTLQLRPSCRDCRVTGKKLTKRESINLVRMPEWTPRAYTWQRSRHTALTQHSPTRAEVMIAKMTGTVKRSPISIAFYPSTHTFCDLRRKTTL